jgi:hypothetical protein
MSEGWIFQGWVHKNGKGRVGPVSTASLRGLLSAGHLQPADIVSKQFAQNGETCLSSPLSIQLALKNEDQESDESDRRSPSRRE